MTYYEDLEVGDTQTSEGRTVTAADIANFAGVSGDFNRLHLDAEYMADSTYGQRIAHGALIFSIMTGLTWQQRTREERDDIVAFYGLDSIRFTGPTFPGDTIHVESTVVEKTERDHPTATGTVRFENEVVNQDGETVLYCEPIMLVA